MGCVLPYNTLIHNKPMERISAAKAKTLSEIYNKQLASKVLETGLDEFYKKIFEYAESGKTSLNIALKPYLSPHKDYITKVLKDDGYKVRYRIYESYRDVEYIIISW